MDLLAEELIQNLTILQQATSLNHADKINEAVKMYTAAMVRLDALIPNLSPELALLVRRNTEDVGRIIHLLRSSSSNQDEVSPYPTFPIQFSPVSIPMEVYKAPEQPGFRVYWLMRLLMRSIQSGAFLTPDLYVFREVWHQCGAAASLCFIEAKICYFSSLCSAMEPLTSMSAPGDMSKVLQALQKFSSCERELRETLQSCMEKREDAKSTRKTMWSLFSKMKKWRHQEGDIEVALSWACNVLEQAQLFEHWYIYFTQATLFRNRMSHQVKEIINTIQLITTQLYKGPCSLLLQDMITLVQRFQCKCRKSIVHLLPVGVELDPSGL
ncbi:unnamed protein product [Phytomonas sp. EM1]|nr:unnamed protein product [Phytomonas sp. EM1]|eukprot:CCW61786.1 unnamed protein product [Phytomonas sp. isolate EM1]